jgi:hypothetical protein
MAPFLARRVKGPAVSLLRQGREAVQTGEAKELRGLFPTGTDGAAGEAGEACKGGSGRAPGSQGDLLK